MRPFSSSDVAPGGRAHWAAWLLLLIAPLVVFRAVVFQGYTFSRSTFSVDPTQRAGDSDTLPMLDPGAGASQDEPWLFAIRRSLIEGEVPLVNLDNGLGAPLLESLQPGVLYPPNLLLPLLPAAPWMFDLFVLLHVGLLLAGLFVLFRLYTRPWIALAIALTIGLSGVTYQHLNMVHFRSFAWLPWAIYAAVHVARGDARIRHVAVFVAAHVSLIAAGALQEAFLGSLAIGFVFVAELLCDRESEGQRRRRFLLMTSLALGTTLLASPSFVPYLVARGDGDLFTQATAARSTTGLDGDAMLSLLLPNVHGLSPHLLRIDRSARWMTNFATCGAFFACLAFFATAFRPGAARRKLFAVIALATLVAGLKVQHVAWLDFVGRLPFLNEILFTKYHLYLFVLIGIASAIGMEEAARLPALARRRVVVFATVAIGTALCATWIYVVTSTQWTSIADLPDRPRAELVSGHVASIAAFSSVAMLLAFQPRRVGAWIAVIVVCQAAILVPNGWLRRLDAYWTPFEMVGLADAKPRERVLTSVMPNQNLLIGVESLSVFDPVHLRSLHAFHSTFFRVVNPGFDLHPTSPDSGLRASELDAARLLGVTRIHDHRLSTDEGVTPLDTGVFALENTLPRAYLLSRDAFERIDGAWKRTRIANTLAEIRAASSSTPKVTVSQSGSRALDLAIESPFRGVLVVLQAYSHGWTLDGVPARSFLSTVCAFDVDLDAGRSVRVSYWPRGLSLSLPLALLGAVFALVALAIQRRSFRRDP